MLKFFKWYWRKAQAAAATEILARSRKLGPTVKDGKVYVDLERLEDYCARAFIMPSKADDNPQQEIRIETNGIQPEPRATSSERP
jgi:hypothetical protein